MWMALCVSSIQAKPYSSPHKKNNKKMEKIDRLCFLLLLHTSSVQKCCRLQSLLNAIEILQMKHKIIFAKQTSVYHMIWLIFKLTSTHTHTIHSKQTPRRGASASTLRIHWFSWRHDIIRIARCVFRLALSANVTKVSYLFWLFYHRCILL